MTSSEDMKDSPGGRIGHICASDKEYMFVLGGYYGYNGYNGYLQTNYLSAKHLWIYDTLLEKWYKKLCDAEVDPNDIPSGSSGASSCLIDNLLYVFGGYNDEGNSNQLFRLDLKTFKWKHLEPKGIKPIASDKNVSWSYDNKLFIFAGYGCEPSHHHKDCNYQFIFDPNSPRSRGWNNQLVYYDIQLNQWVWPSVKGQVPVPRAAHAAAKVGDRAYIFGGRHQTLRMNDMFFIDLKQMEWKEVIERESQPLKPIGRSWHSLTTLSDRHIVLFGGFTQDNKPLGDCWIFDTHSITWNIVDLPFHKPRLWHSAALSANCEVMVFGGAKLNILNLHNLVNIKDLYSEDLIKLRFGVKSLLRLCLDAIVNDRHSTQKHWCFLPQNIKNILELKTLLTNSAQVLK